MDKEKIQKFFKEKYVAADKYEVINYDIHVNGGIASIWANRINGCEHWTVAIELHECISEKTDTWNTKIINIGYQTDEALIVFIENFDENRYFPIYQYCEADQCAYNNGGICKYENCFGKKPVFDDDDDSGCSGYCHNFA